MHHSNSIASFKNWRIFNFHTHKAAPQEQRVSGGGGYSKPDLYFYEATTYVAYLCEVKIIAGICACLFSFASRCNITQKWQRNNN